jgi:hypothetical protein
LKRSFLQPYVGERRSPPTVSTNQPASIPLGGFFFLETTIMNTLRKFAAAVSLLADSGMDPLEVASIVDLRDAIVSKTMRIDLNTPPAELLAIVGLVEDLEILLDRLAAEHQAINTVADAAA